MINLDVVVIIRRSRTALSETVLGQPHCVLGDPVPNLMGSSKLGGCGKSFYGLRQPH